LLKARSHCPVAEASPPLDFLILEKRDRRAGRFFDFEGTENRSAASSENFQNPGVGKINDQVTVISITHLPRFTPLFMALPEGVSGIDPMQTTGLPGSECLLQSSVSLRVLVPIQKTP
jgi:hypothetical protein